MIREVVTCDTTGVCTADGLMQCASSQAALSPEIIRVACAFLILYVELARMDHQSVEDGGGLLRGVDICMYVWTSRL